MRPVLVAFLAVTAVSAVSARPAVAQTAADTAAIRAASLDYIEGWFEGNAARMERAVHPRLAKRFLERLPNGQVRLTESSALDLVQGAGRGAGRSIPADKRKTEVRILDIFQATASVRIDAGVWIDYLHLGFNDGRWRIINVLWEIRSAP